MSPVREATTTGTTSDAVVTRDGLLARFGLDAAADDQEVETTYDRIGGGPTAASRRPTASTPC
jgi:hypothetical protein